MNGTSTPNNSTVIHIIVITVCSCALAGVFTEAWCYINKIPDMNTPLAGAFGHVVDTLIGALIAMLINTRPQEQRAADAMSLPGTTPAAPIKVEQVNTQDNPAIVKEATTP